MACESNIVSGTFSSFHLPCLLNISPVFSANDALNRFFQREYRGKGISRQICSTCFPDWGGTSDWSGGQAEHGLRLEGLNDTLQNSFIERRTANSGYCKGTKLYSEKTVSVAAVEGHGSVWELHHRLALYEKRRKK